MDNREKLANQLLMRGHASVDDLLYASFGEWPPKGLDIVHENKQRVNLTTSLTDFHGMGGDKQPPWYKKLFEFMVVGGYARTGGERSLYINNMLTKIGGKIGTVSHETAHILQGDHYWRARDIMGKNALEVVFPRPDALSNMIVDEVTTSSFKPGFMRRVMNAIGNATGLGIDYLKSGLEIQARLQEALIEGYPKWERMPQNNTEFFFAMRSVGFDLTPELNKTLNIHPDREEMEKTFPKSKSRFGSKSQFVGDIEKVQANLTPEGKKQFWDYTMPRLYGDLLEMYGDKYGRERMGHGYNETHAFRTEHEQDLATIAKQPWTYAQTETHGNYAYVRLDTMAEKDRKQLLASLDNQFIMVSFSAKNNPDGKFVFVTGEEGMATLKKIVDENAPARPAQDATASTTVKANALKA